MSKKYQEITNSISENVAKLKNEIPQVMKGFSEMAAAATADNILDKKTKELIAIALAVSTKCDGCVGFHAKALVNLGATREELLEALGMAIYMGGGPSLMYAADSLAAFEEFCKMKNS